MNISADIDCPACGGSGVIQTSDSIGLVDYWPCDLCCHEGDDEDAAKSKTRQAFEAWMKERGTPLFLEQTQAYEAFQAGVAAAEALRGDSVSVKETP